MNRRYAQALIWLLTTLIAVSGAAAESLDKTGTLWSPYLEWTLANPDYQGNPYDVEARAVFRHAETGQTHDTGMFYDGGGAWRFRFTGVRTGEWRFETVSAEPALNGHTGVVTIEPNPAPGARGFVTAADHFWAWQTGEDGGVEVFAPQLVMHRTPDTYHGDPDTIAEDIEEYILGHGFSGFHTPVFCRWFDIGQDRSDDVGGSDPNPDPRTFEALEMLITKTHAAGGFVHIWKWGDEDRRMTPIRWAPDGPQEQRLNRRGLDDRQASEPPGVNGPADRRLQRYIAARLGPLPGWTMGYGFDLWEWVRAEELHQWREFMHAELGWPHLLGGRAHQAHRPLEDLMTAELDYVGYETHRPTYETYVEALELHPGKPVFMEDRFRVRDHPIWYEKDYSLDDVRRGLWHSTMAGGVANIWGYLLPERLDWGSRPFPNREQIAAYAQFFEKRFSRGLTLANDAADGMVLADWDRGRMIVYVEDQDVIAFDLSEFEEESRVVAIDTKTPYFEFELGTFSPGHHQWRAHYQSDWALAIGGF